ncbi:shikimate kinase [Paenibacillus sp. P96]|uniref:Shikimate kinase n=1 Tax=Paenibacillus zeirhizosphaerae TaxID=2987519 RepID=A0ABT9FQC3_9BACL|nr:shikimate kinase [Paenibacillus sp. P96]MDP4096864.1 shikimate kinase [Paenibacillus sp. P96]
MMGTGKSTVGALLADKLGYHMVDLDAELERQEGRAIPDIFANEGEAYFRDAETAVLHKVLEDSGQVIATGGGAVLREGNCRAMLGNGYVVALTAQAESIMERVRSSADRPLLAGDVEGRVLKILEERKDAYAFAHVTIDTTGVGAGEVAELILTHYRV